MWPEESELFKSEKKVHVSSQLTLKTIYFKLEYCRKNHSLLKWKIDSGCEKYLHVIISIRTFLYVCTYNVALLDRHVLYFAMFGDNVNW